MKHVRRHFRPGDTVFLTHVTYDRDPILVDNADLIWKALDRQQVSNSFEMLAWVIMPDHVHMLIDPLENELSDLVKRFKLSFASEYRKRARMTSGRVWQNRYWDHIIRDQEDLNRHIDYIHYSPVKHGPSTRPHDYAHSSFNSFLEKGLYERDWGDMTIKFDSNDFGE